MHVGRTVDVARIECMHASHVVKYRFVFRAYNNIMLRQRRSWSLLAIDT